MFFFLNREDREARFLASKMSIVASFRSWSGKHVSILFLFAANTFHSRTFDMVIHTNSCFLHLKTSSTSVL